ncbi:MAG: phosphoribosylaminoimidazolesuccinocarboxamide synthase [Candidatus Magnetoovum sp. WYHC-5]|nr:phosphoribosylaminoimidazolesuccinocarboxamide synthase [Candidatus Magnetoovum sp. WYHC-5]
MEILKQSNFEDMQLIRRGKVRDIYDFGTQLLMVMTDRISAFDVVLPNGIPGKGQMLTKLSVFWFDYLKDIVANHLISTKVEDYPQAAQKYKNALSGRSMFVEKTLVIPVECIVRGYITGSGWADYKKTGAVCGIALSDGLEESQRLPQPIFTPSTKAENGHDLNISFDEACRMVGTDIAQTIRGLSIAIYKKASDYALTRGIIIADTKFEFGIRQNGELILIDEVLTPDSSRFWPKEKYAQGRSQDSFDKQIVRDYLQTLTWNKTYPGPNLTDEIISKTARRYKEIVDILVQS